MKKKIKILIICLLVFCSVGCTKYVRKDGKNVVAETGQNLTANILCKPVTEDLYNIYKENEEYLTVTLDELPSCESFKPSDVKYVSLWESIFIKPIAFIILKVGNFLKNYGLAVMLLSLIIRLLMVPLSKKAMFQSENMKKAQPEINRIEKKYANKTDNDSMMAKAQETMLVYKKYNINPVSGCLTSFIQLPLLFAFLEAINRVPAIFEGSLWTMNLGMTPLVGLSNGNYIYLVLIILIILTTFITFMFSMSTAENNEAANQMKIMMIFMIIVISVASLNFPTALALYWIVNNIFAIVQNLIIKKISERR